jgi:hypothetical protein
MKNCIIITILLVFAAPAIAVTYTWMDDRGTVNFAEDLGSIPKKYRKKAKAVGVEEEAAPAVPRERKEEVTPVPKVKATESAEEQPVAEKKEFKKIYGDKTAAAWKSEFGQLNADTKAAEDQLVELRAKLSDTSKMSRSDYLSFQKTIRNVEERILGLRKKRDALNEDANKAEVPAELRGQ